MDDRDQLKQHYADVFDSEPDADLLQMVDELHETAVLCRQGEPSSAVDRAIAQLARQRRQASASNGTTDHTDDQDTAVQSLVQVPPPTRLRTGWLRQGLGMVAAVTVLVLVAGILAVTFGNQQQSQQGGLGGGATATATPGLPQTVTANGIAVTLESLTAENGGTRITFSVNVRHDLVSVAGRNVVGFQTFPGRAD